MTRDGVKNSDYPRLLRYRTRAFPAYEAILTDPERHPIELAAVLGVVSQVEGDRSRFVDIATTFLTHNEPSLRLKAIRFIGEIGTERDTAPLLAMLSDEEKVIRKEAAQTLLKIGGKRDVAAMSIWLKTGNYRNDIFHHNYVQECRDALDKRLKDAAKEKKKDEKK